MRKTITVIFLTIAMTMTAFAFTGCNIDMPEKAAEQGTSNYTDFVISETKSSGIKLKKASLTTAELTENGVEPQSEGSYTLTATIEPEGAGKQGVNWELAFSTPDSGWADGKTVTDYVTLAVSEDTMTATVGCKAPFGTQITVTATSNDNPDATAVCTLDYAQRVTSASLDFGNLPINLGGETVITYEVAPGVRGKGGTVTANVQTSDVYSLADNFTTTVTLSQKMIDGKFFALKGEAVAGVRTYDGENIIGKQMYYDYDNDIIDWLIGRRNGDLHFDELSTAEIIGYLSDITQPVLYDLTFTVTGAYNSYTYTSQIKCGGYTNNTPVNALHLNESGYVF